jgi:hypothetical protein
MQQILNSRDRNQAFLKFALFFIITIVLVVIAVYFNFRLPVKENKFLTNELANHRAQDEKEAEFVERLDKVVNMMTSMEKSKDSANQLTKSVTDRLAEMKDRSSNSNMFYNKMNEAIVNKFVSLNDKIVESHVAARNREALTGLRASLEKLMAMVPEEKQVAAKQLFQDQIEYGTIPAQ